MHQLLGLAHVRQQRIKQQHHRCQDRSRYHIHFQPGTKHMAYVAVAPAGKKETNQRGKAIGKAHKTHHGHIEDIDHERGAGQRLGAVVPHHHIVGKIDNNKSHLRYHHREGQAKYIKASFPHGISYEKTVIAARPALSLKPGEPPAKLRIFHDIAITSPPPLCAQVRARRSIGKVKIPITKRVSKVRIPERVITVMVIPSVMAML